MNKKSGKSRAPRVVRHGAATIDEAAGRRAKADQPPRVRQPHGGALLAGGVSGHRGRGGRPSNELYAILRAIREDPRAQDALREAACDPESRGFGVAWRILTEYDPDRPRGDDTGQKVEIHVHGPPTGVEKQDSMGAR